MKCTVPMTLQGFTACWKRGSVNLEKAAGDRDFVDRME